MQHGLKDSDRPTPNKAAGLETNDLRTTEKEDDLKSSMLALASLTRPTRRLGLISLPVIAAIFVAIAMTPALALGATQGPKAPTATVAPNQFTNASNAFASDDAYATGTDGQQQGYKTFGFDIPAGSTINGIEVALEGNKGACEKNTKAFKVKLSQDGGSTFTGNVKTTANYDSTDSTKTLGSSSDLWGLSWTLAQINDDLALRVEAACSGGNGTAGAVKLDRVTVTVHFTAPADDVPPTVTIVSLADNDETDTTAPFSVLTNGGATITWKANEIGTFSVRVGGTDCSTGSVVTGANASGSYGTANTEVATGINASDLAEGANTVRVCVTDAASNTGSATATVVKDTTPPSVTIDAIVKVPVTDPAVSALVNVGGTDFVRQTVQIQGTVSDANLDTGSIEVVVEANVPGSSIVQTGLVEVVSCPSATTCTFTADFDTINDTNDGPNNIIASASDLAGNSGSDSKLVMVDNTSPVIGSLAMDQSEYLVGDAITVTASGVEDDLPLDALDALDSVSPAPSGVDGTGAKVETTAGTQPTASTGNFLNDFNALTQSGDPTVFTAPPTFDADAAGPITATAVAKDKVGNLSAEVMTNAVGLNATNLVCQNAEVTSGRTATLVLGTLLNITADPDAPVEGQPVLIRIFDANNVLVFSDSVLTDSDGKVKITNTFNLAHGSYDVQLEYEGTTSAPFLAPSMCELDPGLLVRSLANGGGYVALVGTNPQTGKPFKGTFGFFLDATSGFTANDGDGLLNDPVSPVTYTGGMNYIDHGTKEHHQALTVNSVTLDTTTVTFGGDGRVMTPSSGWSSTTYEVTVQDNGEPGNQNAIDASGASNAPDTFSLTVDGSLKTPNPILQGGNIQVR